MCDKFGVAILKKWLIATAIVLSLSYQHVDAETHRYPYRSQVLKGDFAGVYNKFVTKEDIVLFGEEITINLPILSNGGDVVIFADVINLNAPIDTRTRVETYGIWWENTSGASHYRDLHYNMSQSVDAWEIIVDRRFWEDTWNPETYSYEFRGRDELNFYNVPGDPYKAPALPMANYQLPSGRTAAVARNPRESGRGSDAPTDLLIDASLKSGNIYIFSRQLNICPDCPLPPWSKAPFGDDADINRPIFFQAGGLKGGRGGDGSIWPCDTQQMKRDGCRIKGGESGAAGRGGDAGNLSIFVIDDVSKKAELERRIFEEYAHCYNKIDCPIPINALVRLANLSGGKPPYWNKRYITGSVSEFKTAEDRLSPFYEVFSDDGGIDAHIGESGEFSIKSVTLDEAIRQLSWILTRLDAKIPYRLALLHDPANFARFPSELDYKMLSTKEQEDALDRRFELMKKILQVRDDVGSPNRISIATHDQFADFLLAKLTEAQRWVLNSLLSENTDSEPPNFIVELLECGTDRLYQSSSVASELLTKMCEYQPVKGSTAVESYFTNTGGIYSVVSKEAAYGRYDDVETTLLLESLRQQINSLVGQAILGRQEGLASWNRHFDREYIQQIEGLHNKLKAARDAAKRANALDTKLVRVYDQAADTISALGQSTAAIEKERKTAKKENREINALNVLGLYGKISVDIYTLADAAYKAIQHVSSDVPRNQAELRALQVEYEEFGRYVRGKTETMLAERDQNLRNSLEINRSYISRVRTKHLRFGQILRAIFQQYIESPSLRDEFESNVNGLNQLMFDPNDQLSIELRPRTDHCEVGGKAMPVGEIIAQASDRAMPLGCVEFSKGDVSGVYFSGARDSLLNELPLLISIDNNELQGQYSLPNNISNHDVTFR